MLIDYHERIEIIFMELSQTASNSDHSFSLKFGTGYSLTDVEEIILRYQYVYIHVIT